MKSRYLTSVVGKGTFDTLVDDSDRVVGFASTLDEGFEIIKLPFRGDVEQEAQFRDFVDDTILQIANALADSSYTPELLEQIGSASLPSQNFISMPKNTHALLVEKIAANLSGI